MFAKTVAPFAFALAALLAAAPTVQAAEVPSVQVRYGDLNLATADGQARLHVRLQQAADTLVGSQEVHRSLGEQRVYRADRAATLADAATQVHALVAQAEHGAVETAMATTSESTAD